MANLVVDIGNSRIKAAVFRNGDLAALKVFEDAGCGARLEEVFKEFPDVQRSILSSTRGENGDTCRLLRECSGYFLEMVPGIPVPIVNRYSTPHTLGCDRLAAAVGASQLFPRRSIFIVDLGSAITADIVTSDGMYLGGTISPGMAMRFRALEEYTGRLPRIDPCCWQEYESENIPSSTRAAMVAGVVGGIEMELRGRIEHYSRCYPGLITIFTGGDAACFEKIFKNTIFADYELVLKGLNIILDYNADKKDSI